MRWVFRRLYVMYIYYISEHYVNKLEALVLGFSSSEEGGLYSCGYQQSLYACVKYIEQQHLGHTGYLFFGVCPSLGSNKRVTKKTQHTTITRGENTKHSGNTVGTGLKHCRQHCNNV